MKNDRWMMLCCGDILLCVCVSPWLPYTEWGILLFSVLSALRLYFANDVITGLDQANPKNRTVQEMAVVCMFFIMMMAVIAALYACGQLQEAVKDKLQFSMVLFLVLVYGNAAPKLPFNRHLGLRLPWTTADENTWRYAHRICGYMSFPTAFFMLCGFAMHHTGVQATAFGFGFVGIPAFLSYRYDQKQKKDRI